MTPQGLEPLFALYHKNCLPPIRDYLEKGNYRIIDFISTARVFYLDWAEEVSNINTREEYETKVREESKQVKPVISVVAKSGTGKTTLLIKLITELTARGYRVGTIKHDVHKFDIDHEGKDSWRLTNAGADTMLLSSPAKLAMVKKNPNAEAPSLDHLLSSYFQDVDIVLTEGFKKNVMPKIEVHRRERSESLLCRGEEHDPTLIAVASDTKLQLDVPVFGIDDIQAITDFIVQRFLADHG